VTPLSALVPPEDPTWLGLPTGEWPAAAAVNPFVRYRSLLDSYARALELGWSDQRFVELVESLDARVREVDGTGFVVTPTTDDRELAGTLDHRAGLWVKDETGSVGGSHKARHLFGLALHLAVEDVAADRPLAIASCGNAALAASIIARAAGRPLSVFVPTWAEPEIIDRLGGNEASVTVCERAPDEVGDPCYRAFEAAVADGAVAFGCQGPAEPRTLDGGRTLGWELADQIDGCDRLVVHVGGGALASSITQGLAGAVRLGRWSELSRIDTVQTEGCAPLAAAMQRLEQAMGQSARWPDDLESPMQPWPSEPNSSADGILDDVTYDWLVLAWAMLTTGGRAIVAPEHHVESAHTAARAAGWNCSATGSAGVAGLLTRPDPQLDTALIMSGVG
jgi:threonine synthase